MEWVEATCRLPLVYQHGESSIRQLFEPARDHLENRAAFLGTVSEWLRNNPELIGNWQHYSEDKRATAAYLDLSSLEVGSYAASSGYSDVRVHADPAGACADFIYREAMRVLKGARTR